MFIDFTVKQFFCVSHALAIMISFYNNDFSSICKEVGESYGASADDIKNACAILTAINVTLQLRKHMINSAIYSSMFFIIRKTCIDRMVTLHTNINIELPWMHLLGKPLSMLWMYTLVS